MAFAQLEPFGGPVDDIRAGLGPAVQMNANRKEGTEPISALHFFPWHEESKQARSAPVPDTPENNALRIRALLNSKAKADGK